MLVSIHAPVWGATWHDIQGVSRQPSFNPRTRVGCDEYAGQDAPVFGVSIHAPVWGATMDRL